jgi:hypothetical protein
MITTELVFLNCTELKEFKVNDTQTFKIVSWPMSNQWLIWGVYVQTTV